jgi:hypothetical protein
MMAARWLILLALVGCGGGDSDDTDTDLVDSADSDDTVDTGPAETFAISGNAVDLMTSGPAAEGLCVVAIDPTPVLTGSGEPDVLAQAVTGADGAFLLENVSTAPAYGMFILVQDCGSAATVMPTATGIGHGIYSDLAPDSTVERPAVVISAEFEAGMEQSIAVLGPTVDLTAGGAMIGFIMDANDAPVSGATIGCPSCTDVYYFDDDASDGLFSSGSGANVGTSAAAGAMFLVPAAPMEAYNVQGDLTWQPDLFGALPGMATIAQFRADP